MPQHIRVVAYDAAWPHKFAQERRCISAILQNNCLHIYHIGSTAVPDLAAKPIIDMMVIVRSLAAADDATDKFSAVGYECLGEFGIARRRYLRKGGDERTHQIHIFQADDWQNIVRHLAFRDFMRTHDKERQAYAQLKYALAQSFPYDIDSYCAGKENFVRKIEALALSQYDCIWDKLYLAARKVQYPRKISPRVEAGTVAAALLTAQGNIYSGVCIDTACSLGMCAERNAVASMITHGESRMLKLIVVMPDGTIGMPCGACREIMMQLDKRSGDIEIMCDYATKTVKRLQALLPDWWAE